MSERAPTNEQQREPIVIPRNGPNIVSTLDKPLDPKRLRAFMATVRRDVLAQRRRPQTGV